MPSTFTALTFYYLTICVFTFYPVDFYPFDLFTIYLLSIWLFYVFDLFSFDFQQSRLFTRWLYVRWLSVRLPYTFRLFTNREIAGGVISPPPPGTQGCASSPGGDGLIPPPRHPATPPPCHPATLSLLTPRLLYYKVCSVGKLDRQRYVTQGNPLRPSEWGFKIGCFPNIYGDFYTFSCFSLDTEDLIFRWSKYYRYVLCILTALDLCNFQQYCIVLNRVKESSRWGDVTAKAAAEWWKGAGWPCRPCHSADPDTPCHPPATPPSGHPDAPFTTQRPPLTWRHPVG